MPLSVGDASGSLALRDAPPLRWRTRVESVESPVRQHRVFASLQGSGVDVAVHIATDPGTQAGAWVLNPSVISLTPWLKYLTGRLGVSKRSEDFNASGTLHVQGEGRIMAGSVEGALRCRMLDGELSSVSRSLHLAGIGLSLDLDRLSPLTSSRPQTLTFSEATFNEVTAHHGEVMFHFMDGGAVRIERARLEVYGGVLEMSPGTFPVQSLLAGEVSLHVNILHISLAAIAGLLPEVVAEARGRLSGEIGIEWTKGGFKLGKGSLEIERLESVEVRLTPQPGFLTDHAPERLALLPSWTGALGRLFMPRNPAYETLRQIEMGLMTLRVDSLAVQLHPTGDSSGPNATVRLSARPTVASAVDKVEFDVNVFGPLDEVLKLGLGSPAPLKAATRP